MSPSPSYTHCFHLDGHPQLLFLLVTKSCTLQLLRIWNAHSSPPPRPLWVPSPLSLPGGCKAPPRSGPLQPLGIVLHALLRVSDKALAVNVASVALCLALTPFAGFATGLPLLLGTALSPRRAKVKFMPIWIDKRDLGKS